MQQDHDVLIRRSSMPLSLSVLSFLAVLSVLSFPFLSFRYNTVVFTSWSGVSRRRRRRRRLLTCMSSSNHHILVVLLFAIVIAVVV
mgnify:CR=1 FL=1